MPETNRKTPLKIQMLSIQNRFSSTKLLRRLRAAKTLNRYGMKMDLTKLKEKLLNIQEQEKLLRDHFESLLSDLKETERIIIEAYIVSNAVYRPFEKVLRKNSSADDWQACFIGRREINGKTWNIEYFTHPMKKDGSPSKVMSTYPCPDESIRPYE